MLEADRQYSEKNKTKQGKGAPVYATTLVTFSSLLLILITSSPKFWELDSRNCIIYL